MLKDTKVSIRPDATMGIRVTNVKEFTQRGKKMEDRVFVFSAKGTISGEINFSSDKDIKRAIKCAIEDGVGEIEIGEDGGASPEFDAIFGRGDVEVEVNEISIEIGPEPFCEGCGERYTDFGITISYGGTGWCANCAEANDEIPSHLIKDARKKVKKLKIKYYKDKLKELEK